MKRRRLCCHSPKGFFESLSNEELESRYEAILEEQFTLKTYGNLSLLEQEQIHAEDRRWWYERLKKKIEDDKKAASKAEDV